MIEVGEGKYKVFLRSYDVGQDKLLIITGGEEEHIGAASLKEKDLPISTLKKKGHKEHHISEAIAQRIYDCIERDLLVVCGIHIDNATAKEIDILVDNANSCVDLFLNKEIR
ncbi:Conserved protein [hydrothermal vent metagenome]|uniref:Conserved protein n=1 Tax=hydrothermal vent metagenome TaxID=652676 RepID=A0A1W1EG86_9ZZZZ